MCRIIIVFVGQQFGGKKLVLYVLMQEITAKRCKERVAILCGNFQECNKFNGTIAHQQCGWRRSRIRFEHLSSREMPNKGIILFACALKITATTHENVMSTRAAAE